MKRNGRNQRLLPVVALALIALAAFAAATKASSTTHAVPVMKANPPTGVVGTPIARGTYDSFKMELAFVQALVRGRSTPSIDVVVQKHDFAPGGSTGWHSHPGPILITVTQGQVTFYERNDPTCSPHVVSAGQGYVDTGAGHIGRNETGQPAQDVVVALAPVAGAFRTELTAPGPYCSF